MIIITYVEEYDNNDYNRSITDYNNSDFSIKYFSSEENAATFIAETQLENEGSDIQHVLINYLSDLEEIAKSDLFGRDIEFHGSNMDLHYAENYESEETCDNSCVNCNMATRISDLAKRYYSILKQERVERETLAKKELAEKQRQKEKEYKLRVFEELRKELGK